jgi:uncharacterized protein (TIGR01777 family)
MKILMTGATGFIGSKLIDALSQRGDEVIAVTRNTSSAAARALATKRGITVTSSPIAELVSRVDAVVNLAGEPVIGKRWTPEQKKVLRDSRVKTTNAIFEAIERSSVKPRVVVSASAIGYYGPTADEVLTEDSAPGSDFLATLCADWEKAALERAVPGVRTVVTRIGVVLGREGGALEQMARPFRLFGGGPVGDGSQWISWIHIDDVVGLLLAALDDERYAGVYNLTAPEPLTNREFSKLLGKALHRPSWLPVPKAALKVAFGEVAYVLTTGQRVKPAAALKSGYRFQHPSAEEALRSLLS